LPLIVSTKMPVLGDQLDALADRRVFFESLPISVSQTVPPLDFRGVKRGHPAVNAAFIKFASSPAEKFQPSSRQKPWTTAEMESASLN
jgi:hypothetical protein